jgi:serine/threonine protein kinase
MTATFSKGKQEMIESGIYFGSFRIIGPIGAGGMGVVYRATDTNLKRDVAIKVLPESFAQDADRLEQGPLPVDEALGIAM